MRKYTLRGRLPVAEPDLMKWGKWFQDANRRVAYTEVPGGYVSTVFLGMDHGFAHDPKMPPLLFETLVFGGPLDGEMERYITWDEAETGHRQMVERCNAETNGAVLVGDRT